MAKFSRIQVIIAMDRTGLVPLFYNEDIETCKKIVDALYKGGARLLEFTARGDFAHEVFGKLSKYCSKEYSDMILGVGSVTSGAEAALYMQLGANFVVTPVFQEEIAITCNKRKVLWSPGCGTLTEISKAEALGCEIVKLFPGSIYGPGFIKAIKGPCSWTSIMPTGGVSPNEDNIKSWIKAGAVCLGMGSKLIVKNAKGEFDYERIQDLTEKSLEWIKKYKS
ncbi:bifunctional 4-hydroxy-2-oxoglutarate aldolase/2-dehydro-3-deoxy-phosphogluconate aldolase [uncultured Tenacibaculum sp.]|uniref:bifunctional 4-hydroxy-2-oxoglutarate aldolase/2-dehydro-3-deoxy-phosphogluconate aldolase n=1 Tax=uncultured Tenacibaculum sp. TaxID=174713 RepID=UPI002623714E|nr:bifunctional 4-hydroxy-2-oxoglutarate aldolase/2-dehydro-3-deoxy-phosphogluconate aldolase [uncultured Tenacibaculum sp.]